MYLLNKIVGFVISPVGLAILGGCVALLCARRNHPRAALWLGWLTVIWLWFWMTPLATLMVGVPLEREFLSDGKVPKVETFPRAEAIVLLGGGMGADTNISSYAEMSASADRVWQAARLFKAGKAEKIVSTGVEARDSTLPLLKEFGIKEDNVFFLEAKNTEEEAKAVAKFGLRQVLLVTSAWHMKRARLMFEKFAPEVEVVCTPTDFEQTVFSPKSFSFKAFLPDANAFIVNSTSFHEWLGIVCYKLFR